MGKSRMSEDVFKWAAEYAALGWYVVQCYGANGSTCTCYKGDDCDTPGKHPVGKGWGDTATVDEDVLADWFDGEKNRNIGVLLGPKSGIVDIEFDCEEGRETAEKFGLDKAYTPTYTSKRSTHRLFKYDARLPDMAVVKINGLEIRIGGGKKASQSVMPPSAHASGASYSWVEGMSHADCEVAEIPRELLVRIANAAGEEAGERKKEKPATSIVHTKVNDGEGRHESLVRFAALKCIKMLDHDNAYEQQEVLSTLHAINEKQIVPPKSNDEVDEIFNSALMWAKSKAKSGEITNKAAIMSAIENHVSGKDDGDDKRASYTVSGLEYRDNEWWPGQWKLTVVHSDPVQLTLRVPYFQKVDGRSVKRYAEVPLTAEAYRNSGKVAEAILQATHTVVVDPIPEHWAVIWNGRAEKRGNPAVRGLKAKLMEEAGEEAATPENCHFAQVAGWLLDALTMTPKPDDDDEQDTEPDPTGYPTWVKAKDGSWELWFAWSRVWEAIHRGKRQLEDGDKLRCKKMIEAAAGAPVKSSMAKGDGGRHRRFLRFTEEHMNALERIAGANFDGLSGKLLS